MKRAKRIISLLLSVVFTLSLICALSDSAIAASTTYDANAAISYAKKYWNVDPYDVQCAEFVSNCLKAGGCSAWDRRCSTLVSELKSGGYGTLNQLTIESSTLVLASKNSGKVSPGDPIFVYCTGETDGRPYVHVFLCAGKDSSGYLTGYAHNKPKNNERIQYPYCNTHPSANIKMYAFHMSGTTSGNSSSTEKILTMSYNVNGGTLNSTEYKATSAGIVQKDGANVTRKWAYGTGDTKNGLINATTFGLTRSGYTFVGWSLSKDGTSAIFGQDDTTLKAETIYPNIKNGSASVTLYAVWQPAEKILTMLYNVNGGTLNSTEYKATSAGIVQKDGANVTRKWAYGTGDTKNGLINASTFGLTRSGYKFVGWSASKYDTSTIFDQDDTTLKAETIYPNIKNGSASIILYAVWKPEEANPCTNGHTWDDGVVTREPTSSSTGIRTYTCAACGETKTETIPSLVDECASGHTWNSGVVTREPTSSSTGVRIYTCAVCGETKTETIPMLVDECTSGHTWDSGIITREPTTTSTGVRTYTCTVCGEKKTEEIPPENVPENTGTGLDNFTESDYYYNGMFRDVSSSDWFADNVAMSYRIGLMKGTSGVTFDPGKNISIAETITIAARLHSIYHTGGENYTSYDGGTWYDPYVDYARENGIISSNYNYSQPTTRELFAHILAQALPGEALYPVKDAISFADSGRITYRGDIELLTRAGIIAGIESGGALYFQPDNTITRAEVAAIVTRMAKTELRVY